VTGNLRHRHHPAYHPDPRSLLPPHPEVDGLHAEDAGAGPILKTLKEKYKGIAAAQPGTMNLTRSTDPIPSPDACRCWPRSRCFIALVQGAAGHDRAAARAVLPLVNDCRPPSTLMGHRRRGYTVPISACCAPDGRKSMFVQQKMTRRRGMEPAQQKMMLFMPIIFTFMFWSFPDRGSYLLADQQRPRHRAAGDVQPEAEAAKAATGIAPPG